MRKISFETLGCRYNQYETAEMAYELKEAGFQVAGIDGTADVVVINTCTVTDKSDARCRAAIRKAKEANPKAQVVVAGCYAETNPDEIVKVSGVDLVLGNISKFSVADLLDDLPSGDTKVIVGEKAPEILPVRPVGRIAGRTNAYLNIQTGCNETCAFCIVRIARGKNRSSNPDKIIEQIGRISNSGIREVVLSGVNLGDYGKNTPTSLAMLVRRMLDETALERIRFSSINPNTITDELIDLIASSNRVCRHLHIPLQSGSDKILKAMRRPYLSEDYLKLLDRLVSKIPDIGIGADVMVGFPGETEKDFERTYALLEYAPVMMLHVFAYSPRENTDAYTMSGRVDKKELKRRSKALKTLSAKKGGNFRARFVGKTLDTLIENSRGSDGRLKGFSDNYLPVTLDGPDELRGAITPITIISSGGDRLLGKTLAR